MCDSTSKLAYAKAFIIDIISNKDIKTSEANLRDLKNWFVSEEYLKDLKEFIRKKEIQEKLNDVSNELKKLLPWNAILPSEKISNPTTGNNADCNDENTYHIDEFLYEDADLKKVLEDNGIIQNYCANCGSSDIKDTIFISHSLSKTKIRYVFDVLLLKDLSNMRILDVGSRIGAVLYGAYFYTKSDEIFGVEINKDLHDIQSKIISVFNMGDRIKIINEDVLSQQDIVATSDVIILNNVFEFFMDVEIQIKIWDFLRKTVKKGCLIVTIPSLEESLDNLNVYDKFSAWTEKCNPFQEENSVYFDEETLTSFHEIYLYKVK